MVLHSLILDSFLDLPELFRDYAISQSYAGVVNPNDGVLYPDITISIPESIKMEIVNKVQGVLNTYIEPKTMFMRLSMKGVHVPHQAHTDLIMATHTFLLYLNPDDQCQGGTDILEHIDGKLKVNPVNDEEFQLWKQDTNVPDRWKVVGFCPMKFNRAFILRSDLFHRAQPLGGFGDSVENGRMVLTMFFNLR